MIYCPSCGHGLRFDIQTQQMLCDACDSRFDPATTGVMNKNAEEHRTYDSYVFTCPSCGGELLTTDQNDAVGFCPFCGGASMLYQRMERQWEPEYIIPFQITKEQCKELYLKEARRSIFTSGKYRDPKLIEGFRGIYMPYWTYEFAKNRNISLEGTKSHRRGDYVYTDHYNLSKMVHAGYEGASYDAASTFNDTLSEAISPFDVTGAKEFTPAYLSGFYADVGDVDQNIYEADAKGSAENYYRSNLFQDPVFNNYTINENTLKNQLDPEPRPEKMGYFPVWFLAIRSRNNKRVSYAVVNGQTGKVAADLPVSFLKYLIGSLIVAVPLFLILNFFFTLTPVKALLVSAFLALVSMIIVNAQLNRTYTREHDLDDRGLQSIRKKEEAERIAREAAEARAAGQVPQAEKAAKPKEKKKGGGFKTFSDTLVVIVLIIVGVVVQEYAPWILRMMYYPARF